MNLVSAGAYTWLHTASRSKPPAQSKGKTDTHTHTHTDIIRHRHPSMHTDTHSCKHTWAKCVISTLPARQQPALAEPGTSNLCSRSREEMLTGLKREEASSAPSLRVLSRSVSLSGWVEQDTRTMSVCLGRSVSVYLSWSVCLGASVSVWSVFRSGRTHGRTHPRCQ